VDGDAQANAGGNGGLASASGTDGVVSVRVENSPAGKRPYRVPCPKCGAVTRCFESGVILFATATPVVKVERITLQVQQEARRRGMTVEEFCRKTESC
jgi:hypothetical protein